METQTQQKLREIEATRQARFKSAKTQKENIERVLANITLTNRFSDNELRLATLREDITLFEANRNNPTSFQEGLLGNYYADPLYGHIKHLTWQVEKNSYSTWEDSRCKNVTRPIYYGKLTNYDWITGEWGYTYGAEEEKAHLEAKKVIGKVKNLLEERRMSREMYETLNLWENKGYEVPRQIRRMIEIYEERFSKDGKKKDEINLSKPEQSENDSIGNLFYQRPSGPKDLSVEQWEEYKKEYLNPDLPKEGPINQYLSGDVPLHKTLELSRELKGGNK